MEESTALLSAVPRHGERYRRLEAGSLIIRQPESGWRQRRNRTHRK